MPRLCHELVWSTRGGRWFVFESCVTPPSPRTPLLLYVCNRRPHRSLTCARVWFSSLLENNYRIGHAKKNKHSRPQRTRAGAGARSRRRRVLPNTKLPHVSHLSRPRQGKRKGRLPGRVSRGRGLPSVLLTTQFGRGWGGGGRK